MAIDPQAYRKVLGLYPTGVTVITALDVAGQPVAMTVGTFASVSLDPPLVTYLPQKTSSSYAKLRESGDRFVVNVLAHDQLEIGRQVAMRKEDKLEGIECETAPSGLPVIKGVMAWIDCTVDTVVDGGDHDIVIGRVEALDSHDGESPLLFLGGRYGTFEPFPPVA